MKIVKGAAWVLAGLVVLVAVGIAVALLVVDGGFVKSRLQRAMQEKNRTLTIEGEPKLRLFPVAGLTLGRTTLTEPGGKGMFLEL